MSTSEQSTLRKHLLELLGQGGAHADFDSAVADLDPKYYDAKVPSVPHTPWRLLEHMRITQADILAFTKDARHMSPTWPDGYWPDGDGPPSQGDWSRSVRSFKDDRQAMIAVIEDEKIDLLETLPHGSGQTVAREAMLLADHSAYHLGQLIVVRRALGAWKD